MIVEQLVSQELSQWRIAKAKELSYIIVLPESDRLVKKTYNREFLVEVDEGDVPIVVVGGGFHLQDKKDLTQINEVPNVDEVVVDSLGAFPSCTSSSQIFEVNASNMSATEIVIEEINKEQKELPKTMSLDEYIGSRGDQLNYGSSVIYSLT